MRQFFFALCCGSERGTNVFWIGQWASNFPPPWERNCIIPISMNTDWGARSDSVILFLLKEIQGYSIFLKVAFGDLPIFRWWQRDRRSRVFFLLIWDGISLRCQISVDFSSFCFPEFWFNDIRFLLILLRAVLIGMDCKLIVAIFSFFIPFQKIPMIQCWL